MKKIKTKNELTRIICVFVALAIMISSASIITLAIPENSTAVYENMRFSEDRVLVVLDNKESLKFQDYSLDSFDGIGCQKITDLSDSTGSKIQEAMQNITRHILNGEELKPYNGISFGEYNRIISLELTVPGKSNVISAISKLSNMDGILYACPDYEIYTTGTANDTYWLPQQSQYHNKIKLLDAWDITTGSDSVRVGILDTGIDEDHPDLVGNINSSLCRDFLLNTITACNHEDESGHGTHVAGVIGAQGNTAQGISGVCWNVEMVSLRVLDIDGYGWSSYAINAINYAAANNFDILNLSIGWAQYTLDDENNVLVPTEQYNSPMDEAINNFDGLVVCAAGNSNQGITLDNDLSNFYPANCNASNIISVGASDNNDQKRSDSHYGKNTVDLFAPGVNLYTTNNITTPSSPGYVTFSQTSAATSLVTGVAALMLSVNPTLFPEEIKHMIIAGVDEISGLTDYCVSGGRLNAYEAVKFARDHERQYCGSNKSYHTYRCDDCGFYDNLAHDLYITSEGTGNRALRCSICGFAFQCFDTVQYSAIDSMYHVFNCATCGYKCIEYHGSYTYSSANSNDYYHIKTCGDCGYSLSESHKWTTVGTSLYKCTICGRLSTSLIMTLPPEDEELTE